MAKKNVKDRRLELLDSQMPHEEKVQAFFESTPGDVIPLVAAELALDVLHIYEAECRKDSRPLNAINGVHVKSMKGRLQLLKDVETCIHEAYDNNVPRAVFMAAKAAWFCAASAIRDKVENARLVAQACIDAESDYTGNYAEYSTNLHKARHKQITLLKRCLKNERARNK